MARSKKRVISLVLVAVLALSLTVVAMAAWSTTGTYSVAAGKESSRISYGNLVNGERMSFTITSNSNNQRLIITAYDSNGIDIANSGSVLGPVNGLKFGIYNDGTKSTSGGWQMVVM